MFSAHHQYLQSIGLHVYPGTLWASAIHCGLFTKIEWGAHNRFSKFNLSKIKIAAEVEEVLLLLELLNDIILFYNHSLI